MEQQDNQHPQPLPQKIRHIDRVKAFVQKNPASTVIVIILLLTAFAVTIDSVQKRQETRSRAQAVFTTLPVGSSLPSDAECAARVRRNPWEPRPENNTANNKNVYAEGYRMKEPVDGYGTRVTGDFTGTTDEIIQWASCKWGFDEENVRAVAAKESSWKQYSLGCQGGTTVPATNGYKCVGLMQVKGADLPPTHPGTWPYAYDSTAFNVDYALAVRRACFEGKETWRGGNYKAGDEWGCIGAWFSGNWHDSGAETYINEIKDIMQKKPWNTYSQSAGPRPETATTSPFSTPVPTTTPAPPQGITPTYGTLGPCPGSGCPTPTPGSYMPTVSLSPMTYMPSVSPPVPSGGSPAISPVITAPPMSLTPMATVIVSPSSQPPTGGQPSVAISITQPTVVLTTMPTPNQPKPPSQGRRGLIEIIRQFLQMILQFLESLFRSLFR